jgi:PRC-barrel domain
MGTNLQEMALKYLKPNDAAIDGMRCEGMTVRGTAGKILGTLQGFLIDPVAVELKYLVIGTSGLLHRTALLPFQMARVDMASGAIEVSADERDLHRKREHFPVWETLSLRY